MAGLNEDQLAIRDATREFMRDHAGFERLMRTIDGDAGWDADLWRGFAVEMGFAGAGIAESDGGIGLGPVEQAIILEELGRVLAPIPWFESVVLAGGAVGRSADGESRSALLGDIASGNAIATLAMRDATGAPIPQCIGPALKQAGDGWRLNGTAHYVPFGHVASHFVVAARSGPNATDWDGITLIAIPAAASGVSVKRVTSLDLTRPYSTVTFDDVAIEPRTILGQPGGGGDALRRTLIAAAGLFASEQVGGTARSLEETVDYAKQRIQFGRPIGSFQAVKHRLADMKLLLDAARSAADWAARAIASNDDVERAASGARSYCTEAYLTCAGDAIQLHGGIGFTWEHHAHLFFKRARASATLLDPPAHHREAIARLLIDQPEPVA